MFGSLLHTWQKGRPETDKKKFSTDTLSEITVWTSLTLRKIGVEGKNTS